MTPDPEGASGLEIERAGTVLRLNLARPERANALNAEIVEAINAALTRPACDGVRLAVFRGRGRHFCSGFDLSDLEQTTDAGLCYRLLRIETMLQAIAHAPFPTLALAHGRAVGAGSDLFCACRVRIAAPGAMFRMPGWQFGVALGTRRLAHRIGGDRAAEILATGSAFSAEEALAMGFATHIVPESDWSDCVADMLGRGEGLDAVSSSMLLSLTLPDTREADVAALVASASRPGLRERIAAYLASERPKAAKG